MSLIAFAGAAQFATIGYVAGGIGWPVIALLTFLLNARHVLYSAALAPWFAGRPVAERAGAAQLLTDESFALSVAHFRRLGRFDGFGYWYAAIVTTLIPWNLATLAGVTIGASIVDPSRLGIDVIFPAAMAGLAVLLDLRSARARRGRGGRRDRGGRLAHGQHDGRGDRRRRPRAVRRAPGSAGDVRRVRADRLGGVRSPVRDARREPGTARGQRTRRARRRRRGRRVSTDLVPLAFLMWAVTYPSRAVGLLTPGIHRLPRPALEYLQLVGPAVLAAIAIVNTLFPTAGSSTIEVGVAVGLRRRLHRPRRVAPKPVPRARRRGRDRDRRSRCGAAVGPPVATLRAAGSAGPDRGTRPDDAQRVRRRRRPDDRRLPVARYRRAGRPGRAVPGDRGGLRGTGRGGASGSCRSRCRRHATRR